MITQGTVDMISVSLEQVPPYLQEGEYFKSLQGSGGDHEVILVPGGVMKVDSTVAHINDLKYLLRSLQFWIACTKERIAEVFDYIMCVGLTDEILALMVVFEAPFPFLYVLRLILQRTVQAVGPSEGPSLAQLIRANHPCSVDFLVHLSSHASVLRIIAAESDQTAKDQQVQGFLASYGLSTVASDGALDLLMVLRDEDITEGLVCSVASAGGPLRCFQYLVEKGSFLDPLHASRPAARSGNLPILEYLRDIGKLAECMNHAAEGGHLHCVKYLLSIGQPPGARIPQRAASYGHLDVLVFLHENGCEWDQRTSCGAAEGGHLACLEYAHNNGCPWDEDTCSGAAEKGHTDCLLFARRHGCPWDEDTCTKAAANGHLSILQYAHSNGCPLTADNWDICAHAAYGGHLECLQYAHINGCHWDELTCGNAAMEGHLLCLEYAHKNGCPWDEGTCYKAAAAGHLECLRYAHAHGCPWDAETVEHGMDHLPCLVYALENNCPYLETSATCAFNCNLDAALFYLLEHCKNLSNEIYLAAARRGRLDVLQACVKVNLPIHKMTATVAAEEGHQDCVDFAVANDCLVHAG